MTQFGGSLRFVQLPAVVQLLAELGSTGRLCISNAEWTGEIGVRDGQIVEARIGAERGRAALEAIAIALPDGDFRFVDEPVESVGPSEPLVAADERVAYLDRLAAEHGRLASVIRSLKLVPRLAESPNSDSADTQVTIGAAALQLIPALVVGHTLEQVARQHGLARTVRQVAALLEGGLVELEPPSLSRSRSPGSTTSLAAPEPVAFEKPAPPPGVQPFSERLAARRLAPLQRTDAPTVTTNPVPRQFSRPAPSVSTPARPPSRAFPSVSTPPRPLSRPTPAVSTPPRPLSRPSPPVSPAPRSVIPPAIAAHLAAARKFVVHKPALGAPSLPPRQAQLVAAWSKSVVRFFLRDVQAARPEQAG